MNKVPNELLDRCKKAVSYNTPILLEFLEHFSKNGDSESYIEFFRLGEKMIKEEITKAHPEATQDYTWGLMHHIVDYYLQNTDPICEKQSCRDIAINYLTLLSSWGDNKANYRLEIINTQ